MAERVGFELEPTCGRERSGSSQAKSRASRGTRIGDGGESGIRTHVRVSPKHAFQACAFSHSAISPARSGSYCGRQITGDRWPTQARLEWECCLFDSMVLCCKPQP